MNVHKNAKQTPAGRALLVQRVLFEHQSVGEVSRSMGVSRRTVMKWVARYRAGVFGSRARGDSGASSDLDILVDLPQGSSLLDLVGLQLDLGDELGISVDAHTYRSLHPLLRDRILAEEVRIL